MSRLLSLFICVIIAIVAVVTNAQDTLNIGSCTDTILCRAETCTFQPVATGSCMNATEGNQVASQILLCNPNLQTVGELFFFSDPYCTVPTDSETFICGQCSVGKSQKIDCIQKNGFESLAVKKCSTSDCSNGCQTAIAVPKGKCTPTQAENGKTVFLKYEGVQVSNTIDQLIYEGSATCQGKISKINVLPADHCIATPGKPTATLVNCRYAQNNETAPQSMAAVRPSSPSHLRHDSPCPKKDEKKLDCALAIADCVVDCAVGADAKNKRFINGTIGFDPEACIKCIIEKTASGDAKKCCQTLSHFCHFGCDICDHV